MTDDLGIAATPAKVGRAQGSPWPAGVGRGQSPIGLPKKTPGKKGPGCAASTERGKMGGGRDRWSHFV